MLALGLAPSAVIRSESGLVDELGRKCTCCGQVDRCVADPDGQSTDRAWRHYCANGALLDALADVWWFRDIV
jgi:hypothetical protein